MEKPVPPSDYPIWVKISLWGVSGRRGLWAFVALSIACGLASLIYGFRDTRFFLAAPLFALAGLPYWLSIRWVDQHGSWER